MAIKLNLLGIHELDLTLGGTTTATITSPGVLSVTNSGGGTITSLTTTGTSGAATLTAGVLNIPVYAGGVTSVFTRTGAVVAVSGDYTVSQVTGAAPIASPTFTGVPAAPTATAGTNTTQLATTAFVTAAVAAGGGMVYPGAGIPNSTGSAWGTSYGTTGTGNVALSASPTFTGTPTAPTATAGTNTTQLATTAFVHTAVGGGMVYPGAGIPNSTGSAWGTSFTTTGTGTVVALSASPTFTGTVSVATLSASASIQSDVNYNTPSAIPYSGSGAIFVGFGWNATGGGAEMDLWNSTIGYTGGFNFYQNSGAGYALVASISGTGVIKSAGTPVTLTIASGTAALGTTAIAAGSAATVVSVAATGVLSTDNVLGDFNADPTSTVGYTPSVYGGLTIVKYCTAGYVNFKVCNFTGLSITPGAVTLNWRVVR